MRLAALAAALVAAAVIPAGAPGVGVVLVAVLVALALATASRPTPDAVVFGMLALALASLSTLRDAGWLLAIDLAAASLLACVAASGPAVGAALAPLVRLRDAGALVPQAASGALPAVRGLGLGGLVALPFGALFWSADEAFAELGRSVPLPETASLPVRALTFGLVLAGALGLGLAARRPLRLGLSPVSRKLGRWEWAVPLVLLDALFLVFVCVQLTVLFGGRDHVLRSAGLTYAEYARQGFWQLLAAATLTLAVVGAASLVARVAGRGDRILLRVLLGVLCGLTVVVLASAVHRLQLYEDAFGLTSARLAADWFAFWLAGLFLLVAVALFAARVRPHATRVVVAGTALTLLVFSLGNPEARVADRNIERWRETGRLDVAYLSTLGADAAPELARLPPGTRRRALAPLAERLAADEPWSSWNLARSRARDVLEENGLLLDR